MAGLLADVLSSGMVRDVSKISPALYGVRNMMGVGGVPVEAAVPGGGAVGPVADGPHGANPNDNLIVNIEFSGEFAGEFSKVFAKTKRK
eukprot:88932-Pyramimonas_sp.AAC.2